jgi:hypothetical protein
VRQAKQFSHAHHHLAQHTNNDHRSSPRVRGRRGKAVFWRVEQFQAAVCFFPAAQEKSGLKSRFRFFPPPIQEKRHGRFPRRRPRCALSIPTVVNRGRECLRPFAWQSHNTRRSIAMNKSRGACGPCRIAHTACDGYEIVCHHHLLQFRFIILPQLRHAAELGP